jgi:hypothetical protein
VAVNQLLLLTAGMALLNEVRRADIAVAALALILARVAAPLEPAAHAGAANPIEAHPARAAAAMATRTDRFISNSSTQADPSWPASKTDGKSVKLPFDLRNVRVL